MESLLNRFLHYVKLNTRSNEQGTTVPSTQSQVDFAQILVRDLEAIGLSEIQYNPENGFVTATLPSNLDHPVDTLGFIAHMDTADFNAENIQPRIIENYDGNTILLNEENGIAMTPELFPNLKKHVGKTLITTDGMTLLGADDKAGLTEIIEAMRILINAPHLKHGEIRIAFGPDEEIGRGADRFDAKGFRARYAYTMDGSLLGEIEYESFNAAKAIIKLHGISVHPGSAKDTMINTSKLAMEFDALLPQNEVPEHTEGYEGFYLLHDMQTTIDSGSMHYILRDHDKTKFLARKQTILDNAAYLNAKYKAERFSVELSDQYYNMGDVIKDDMKPVELAIQAMKNLGIEPKVSPIRGGTDGSKISFMGIPTPNLFTGGDNYHGQYEYAVLEDMQKAIDVILEIIRLNQ